MTTEVDGEVVGTDVAGAGILPMEEATEVVEATMMQGAVITPTMRVACLMMEGTQEIFLILCHAHQRMTPMT